MEMDHQGGANEHLVRIFANLGVFIVGKKASKINCFIREKTNSSQMLLGESIFDLELRDYDFVI